MTEQDPPRNSPVPVPLVPTPRLSGGDRLTILSRWLFRGDKPEEYHFHAGEVLIEEGESLTHRPALLVVEGEIEECIGSYDPDSGPAEHTVQVAGVGDLANLQAVIEPFHHEPAQCSLHASTDGYCYLIWKAHVQRLPEFAAALAASFPRSAESIERMRALAAEFEELSASSPRRESAEPMSVRSMLDEWADTELDELKRKLEETRDELERTKVTAWEAGEKHREAQQALDLERRARAALEQRALELMQQLAGQTTSTMPPDEDDRFPSAVRLLESAELEAMESEARRHREMAVNYEYRARMLHHTFELLASDNPAMVIRPTVMHLMMGEEPGLPSDLLLAEDIEASTEEPEVPKRVTLPLMSSEQSASPPSIPRPARLPTPAPPRPEMVPPSAAPRTHKSG